MRLEFYKLNNGKYMDYFTIIEAIILNLSSMLHSKVLKDLLAIYPFNIDDIADYCKSNCKDIKQIDSMVLHGLKNMIFSKQEICDYIITLEHLENYDSKKIHIFYNDIINRIIIIYDNLHNIRNRLLEIDNKRCTNIKVVSKKKSKRGKYKFCNIIYK